MRFGIIPTLLLACALAWAVPSTAAAVQQTLVLGDTVTVPVRAVAPWLGAAVTLEPGGVRLSLGDTTLAVTFNRTKATRNGTPCTLPAPAFQLDGISYLPARTLAECFHLDFARDARAGTLTLTSSGHPALVFHTQPYPRPACIKEETLAGLTLGDHLAYAVARWGDPTGRSDSLIPQATDYTFRVDPAGGLALSVSVRDDQLLLISVTRTGAVAKPKIAAHWLRDTGSNGGMVLYGEYPQRYGAGREDYAHDTGDVILTNFTRGSLTLIGSVTLDNDVPTLSQLILARRGVNADWLPLQGPL